MRANLMTMTVCRYCHCVAEGDVCVDCGARLLEFMETFYQTPEGKALLDKVIKSAHAVEPAETRVGPELPGFPFPSTNEFTRLCLAGLKQLARNCDGARAVDHKGFGKYDVEIGMGMASQTFLTKKQQPIAARLIIKYRKQLSPQLVEEVRRFAERERFLD